MNLGNDKALWLLFAVPVVLIPVYAWCFWRKALALRILASNEMLRKINSGVSLQKQMLKAALLLLAFVSIVLALTEPKWNPQPQQIRRQGRDVAILLDTSKSMLAEDIKPNRLERSKLAIRDLLEVLRGDRIAIVTFAGNATVKCPLTQDYAFVRMALADISPESSSRGGTMIGDAIRKATEEVFDKQSRQYKDLILITDGEDHDSFPVEAAKKAGQGGDSDHRHRPGRRRHRLANPDHRPERRKDVLEVQGPGGVVQAGQRHAAGGCLCDRTAASTCRCRPGRRWIWARSTRTRSPRPRNASSNRRP